MNIFNLNVDHRAFYKVPKKIINMPPLWHQKIDRWFSVCPVCEKSVRKACFGEFSLKFSGKLRKRETFCSFSKSIRETLINNFDHVIAVLNKTTGLLVTADMARQWLIHYHHERGWSYFGTTLENLPWSFVYRASISESLFGRKITDHALREDISKVAPYVTFDNKGTVKNNSSNCADLAFCFLFHDRKIVDGNLEESITLSISTRELKDGVLTNPNVLCDKNIPVDHELFKKLIKTKEQRQLHWVELAKSVLGG